MEQRHGVHPGHVAFTFNLIKTNTAINLDGLNISSVTTSGNNVTVSFPTSQYANLQNDRRNRDRAAVGLEQGRQPDDLHRRRTRSAPDRTC